MLAIKTNLRSYAAIRGTHWIRRNIRGRRSWGTMLLGGLAFDDVQGSKQGGGGKGDPLKWKTPVRENI